MPKPRKPTQLKALSGTKQPCREEPASIELPLVDEIPDAPSWLPNAHAVKEWDRLAPILFNNGLLTEASLSTLGILCSLLGKMCQLLAAGESPTGHLAAQYISLAKEFGLTPVSLGKVRPGEKAKTANRFTSNGSK